MAEASAEKSRSTVEREYGRCYEQPGGGYLSKRQRLMTSTRAVSVKGARELHLISGCTAYFYFTQVC